MTKKFLCAAVIVCFLTGCYYDTTEELYGKGTCDTSNVTYTNTITDIINRNACIGCHSGSSPAGGFQLLTYANVKAKVTDGRLLGAINHLGGFTPMPQNLPKMTQCDLNKVQAWVDAGMPQ